MLELSQGITFHWSYRIFIANDLADEMHYKFEFRLGMLLGSLREIVYRIGEPKPWGAVDEQYDRFYSKYPLPVAYHANYRARHCYQNLAGVVLSLKLLAEDCAVRATCYPFEETIVFQACQ